MFADPAWNAPAWIHTNTGAGDGGVGFGVQMFNRRQSSLPWIVAVPGGLIEGHGLAARVASSVDGFQGAAGCGGFHRSALTGGAANGMPRKTHTAPCSRPRTVPAAVPARHDVEGEGPAPDDATHAGIIAPAEITTTDHR